MTAWAAIAGNATVWLLVLVLFTGFGYGAAFAWGRWGGRLPIPEPVGRAVSFALGPPGSGTVVHPPLPRVEAPARPKAPEPERIVVPVSPAPAETAAGATAVAELEPVHPAVPAPANPSAADARSTAGDGAPAPAQPAAAPSPRAPRPVRTLSRADALAELSGVLHLEYEAAAALLDHGLWGFENYDEWTRSMRGAARPEDVSEEAWDAVTHRSWGDLEEEVATFRARQAALTDLETLWGVGPDEAAALYDAGYTELAAIREASTDTIAKVPGIGAAKAFQIRAAAHGLAPTP